jgi:polyisoprenoid-binding protein YceI
MRLTIGSTIFGLLVPFAVTASLGLARATVFADDALPTSAASQKGSTPSDVDVERSRVYVFVGKTGFGHEHGVEGRLKSGFLHLDAQQKAGEVEFDLTSFSADTTQARRYVGLNGETDPSTREQVTANMIGKYVLDTEQFPTAKFVIDSAIPLKRSQPNSPRRFQLDGQLYLHGTSQPVRIIVQAQPESGAIHLRGEFTMMQTDYNITPFRKALGAVGVTNKLRIYGDLVLVSSGR